MAGELTVELAEAKIEVPYKPDHPLLPVTRAKVAAGLKAWGVEEFNRKMRARNERIHLEERDPFNHLYEPPMWWLADVLWGWRPVEDLARHEDAPGLFRDGAFLEKVAASVGNKLLVLGGNRGGKTTYLCKRAVDATVRHAGHSLMLFHSNEKQSVEYHQSLVFRFLPESWRTMGKQKKGVGYVSFTLQNGFSNNKLTGPNASVINFFNYEQDPDRIIEGAEPGSPDRVRSLGVATDELVPEHFLETLAYRLPTRNAALLSAFTAKNGYTGAVPWFLDGAEVIHAEAGTDLRVPKQIPKVRRGRGGRAIINFFNKDNPWGTHAAIRKEAEGVPDGERMVRLYGEPTRRVGSRFPRFQVGLHTVPPEAIYEDRPDGTRHWKGDGTNYLVVDPAGRKNFFMVWCRVDPWHRLLIYREFPCPRRPIPGHGYLGPWAEPGRGKGHVHDGIPGEGAAPLNLSLLDYKAIIALEEKWDDARTDRPVETWQERHLSGDGTRASRSQDAVVLRYLDSRFAQAPQLGYQGTTTLQAEFAKLGLVFLPTKSGAANQVIAEGEELIADALGYTEGFTNPADGPRLLISEECENVIYALRTYTGLDGPKGATKDPIDCLRYLFAMQVDYVPPRAQAAEATTPGRKWFKDIFRRQDGAGY